MPYHLQLMPFSHHHSKDWLFIRPYYLFLSWPAQSIQFNSLKRINSVVKLLHLEQIEMFILFITACVSNALLQALWWYLAGLLVKWQLSVPTTRLISVRRYIYVWASEREDGRAQRWPSIRSLIPPTVRMPAMWTNIPSYLFWLSRTAWPSAGQLASWPWLCATAQFQRTFQHITYQLLFWWTKL